jgi:antitoxin CptB
LRGFVAILFFAGKRHGKMQEMDAMSLITHQADPVKRARLRWRGRRGLLENDLIITRFLDAYEETLTDEEVEAFSILMELPDNDLLNLLLARNEPEGESDLPQVRTLLARMRAI